MRYGFCMCGVGGVLVAKNMVCAGFAADVALVFSVCVLHMSDTNVGLPLYNPILAGIAERVCSHVGGGLHYLGKASR